ncbi:MAG: sporulation protein YqfD [Clostridia bacterium]|nr:sporulation protein YqfD [Clostridia bacterium]
MSTSLWNFVCGFAKMTVEGQQCNRFIRICCARDICLINLKFDADSISFDVDHGMVKEIQSIATKCNCHIKSVTLHGRPVVYKAVVRSLGLLLGVLVSMAMFFLGTSFITKIEVQGNDSIAIGDLLEYLETQGIYIGAIKYGISDEHVSNQLLLADSRISWAEFDVQGTVATLKISEANYISSRPNGEICDIVAARDGYIVGITCLSGHSLVKVGRAVSAGEILVSHFVSEKEEKVVSAKAVVMAIVWETYSQDVPKGTEEDAVWDMLRRRVASEMEGMTYKIVNTTISRGLEVDEYSVLVEYTTNIAKTKYIEGTVEYDGDSENIH